MYQDVLIVATARKTVIKLQATLRIKLSQAVLFPFTYNTRGITGRFGAHLQVVRVISTFHQYISL